MCYKTTLCRLCSHHPTLQHPGVHRAASSCTARPLCSMHLPGAAAQGGEKKRKGGKMKGNVAEVLIKGFFSTSSLVFTGSLSCFAFISILLVPNRPPLSHGSVLHWGTRRDGRLQVLLGEIPWDCGKVTHISLDPVSSFHNQHNPHLLYREGSTTPAPFSAHFHFLSDISQHSQTTILPFFASQIVKITQTATLAPCLQDTVETHSSR